VVYVSPSPTKPKRSSLYAELARYRHGLKSASRATWQMGDALSIIYDDELWSDEYSDWPDFVSRELRISLSYANCLIRVSRAFSEDKVAELGVSKCRAILRADPKDRPKLTKECSKKEMTSRQVADRVTEVIASHSHSVRPVEGVNGITRNVTGRGHPQRILRVEFTAAQFERLTFNAARSRLSVEDFARHTILKALK
jgi:hypothetical protein